MGPTGVLALVVATTVSIPTGEEREPLSITFQGAASLGTYEAGFGWTVIRLARADRLQQQTVRRRRLTLGALSGSSAGSINAVLAAALWCEADDETGYLTVDRNLLRDSWLPVGLDELLPSDPTRYAPGDGLFASSAFAPVVDTVLGRVFSKSGIRFRQGCRVPVGFTVTRVVPELLTLFSLRVQSQQAVVPLIVEVDRTGAAWLRSDATLPATPSLPSRVALAESIGGPGAVVPADEAIQALLASAAFPLAFGARPLCECRVVCTEGQREVTSDQCPGPVPGKAMSGLSCAAYGKGHHGQDFKLCRSNFLDGGFLNNAPVGLAVEQAEAFVGFRPFNPLSVFLLDPDLRRPRDQPPPRPERTAQGITGSVALVNDLVNTAREQRLAESIASRHWNVTAQALLRGTATALSSYASVVSRLEGSGASAVVARAPWRPVGEERGPVGRLLGRCLRNRSLTSADLDSCVGAVEGSPTLHAASGQDTTPLSAEDVVRLVEDLGTFIEGLGSSTPGKDLSRRATVAAGALAFVADELPHLRSLDIAARTVRQGSTAARRVASQVQALAARATERSHIALAGVLRRLMASGAAPSLIEAASSASATLAAGENTQLFSGALLAPVKSALAEIPESDRSEAVRMADRQLSLLEALRPQIASLNRAALLLAQNAAEISSEGRGERRLAVGTRFSPLAGEKLEHFAGFLDRPFRELDYLIGVYEGLHAVAAFRCSEPDLYLVETPPLLKADGSWEIDLSREETQRCIGTAMRESIDFLQILASPRAAPVVRALARRELAASVGSSAEADRFASTQEWSWLGNSPPDLRSMGAMGVALTVLLQPSTPCTASAKEPLCVPDLTLEQFLPRLAAADYQAESQAMKAALADQGRWLSQTVHRALDRAGTIEIAQGSSGSSASTRSAVNTVIGGGETLSRAGERRGEVLFLLDPSTIPLHPLADGSYVPIVLAHLVPYRVALDVVGGSIALSWLEPRLQLGRWFSVDSTLQLIDIQFNTGIVSTTLGARGVLHLGPVGIGSGPRWQLAWGGGSQFGVEFDLLLLQDRVGVSFGFRNLSAGTWNTPFVALTIADLNGTLYGLVSPAWRSGR
jgi:predicted acylesterase/phospholipase RssA